MGAAVGWTVEVTAATEPDADATGDPPHPATTTHPTTTTNADRNLIPIMRLVGAGRRL